MLDRAWAHAFAGENEDALRAGIAMVEADPLQLQAVLVLAHALVAAGRTFAVADAEEQLDGA